MNRRHGNFEIDIILSNFLGSRVVEIENEFGDGCEQGLFIPFKLNGLKETKGKFSRKYVVMKITANENTQEVKMRDWKNGSHHLRLEMDTETREYIKSLGYPYAPFIGHMRPIPYFWKNINK